LSGSVEKDVTRIAKEQNNCQRVARVGQLSLSAEHKMAMQELLLRSEWGLVFDQGVPDCPEVRPQLVQQ
jgi:hypothetical protein